MSGSSLGLLSGSDRGNGRNPDGLLVFWRLGRRLRRTGGEEPLTHDSVYPESGNAPTNSATGADTLVWRETRKGLR